MMTVLQIGSISDEIKESQEEDDNHGEMGALIVQRAQCPEELVKDPGVAFFLSYTHQDEFPDDRCGIVELDIFSQLQEA